MNQFVFNSQQKTFAPSQSCIELSSVIGQCNQAYQEDLIALYETPKKPLCWSFGVFDGHGGATVSEQLGDPRDGLLPALMQLPSLTQDSIKQGYIRYNQKFAQEKAGSTAVTFIVDLEQKKYFFAHCGDSTGLLIAGQKLLYKTVAHNSKSKAERERIHNSDGVIFEGRVRGSNGGGIAVARSFGDSDIIGFTGGKKLIIPDPDVHEGDLKEPIIVVLFSDGFSDYFSGDSRENENFFDQLKDIICQLMEIGRPINGLAKDLIALMNFKKSTSEILIGIKENTDWKTLEIATTAALSRDNVSLIIAQINPPVQSEDNKDDLLSDPNPKNNSQNEENSVNTVLTEVEESVIQGPVTSNQKPTFFDRFNKNWLKIVWSRTFFKGGFLLIGLVLMYVGFMKHRLKSSQ